MKLVIKDTKITADLVCYLEYNETDIDLMCETPDGKRFTLLSLYDNKTYALWTGDMEELGFVEA